MVYGTLTDISERKQAEGHFQEVMLTLQESEERWRVLLENAPDPIYIRTGANFAYLNEATVDLFGAESVETLLDTPVLERIHKDSRKLVIERMRQTDLQKTKQPLLEQVFNRMDGNPVPVEISAVPINFMGKDGILVFARDITERKQAEKKLRASEERYRSLANNIPDVIYSLDGEGNILTVNTSAFERYGYSEQEIQGKPFLSFIHPEDREKVIGSFVSAVAEKRKITRGLQFRIMAENGSCYWFELNSHARFDNDGHYLGEDGLARDITERKAADLALSESETRFKTIFNDAPIGIALVDSLTWFVYEANPMFARITGRNMAQKAKDEWIKITHPDDIQKDEEKMALMNAGEIDGFRMEKRYLVPTSGIVWVNMTIVPFKNQEMNQHRQLTIIEDITKRKQVEFQMEITSKALRESEDRYREMVALLSEGIYITDKKARFVFVNPAMEELFGVTAGGLVGRDVRDFLSSDQRMLLEHQLKLRKKKIASNWEVIITRPDGKTVNLLVSATPRLDQEGIYIGAIGICRNITQKKSIEDRMLFQISHDNLTNLYNRQYFDAEMERLQKSRQFPVSILMIDVDGLKKINDLLGHPAGDEILCRAARILKQAFRPEDVVARIGGDEFVVILPGTDSETASQAEQRLKNLLQEHNKDFPEGPILSLSMGVATGKKKSKLSDVFSQADKAMYVVKASMYASPNNQPVQGG